MNLPDTFAALDAAGFRAVWLMLSALWQSSILLAAAGLLAWLLRRHRAGLRHAILAAAVLACPLIPLTGLLVPRSGPGHAAIPVVPAYSAPAPAQQPGMPTELPVQLPPLPAPAAASPEPLAAPEPSHAAPIAHAPEAPSDIPLATANRTEAGRPPQPATPDVSFPWQKYPWAIALAAYAAGALGFLTLVALGKRRIARCVRTGRGVTDPRVLAIFRTAGQRLGVSRRVRLVETPCIAGPLTVGALHPVILLPAGFPAACDDADLTATALHELSHVRRWDSPLLALLSLVRAVLFFHPLIWLACRQASTLAEQACDDAVLAATGAPVPYAKMLARLAAALPRRALATELSAGFLLSRGAFLRRIESILSPRRARLRRLSRLALLATILASTLSLALALALPLGEQTPTPSPTTAAALTKPSPAATAPANGQPDTPASARQMAADSQQTPPADGWGRAVNGLRVGLGFVCETFLVGRPIAARVEIQCLSGYPAGRGNCQVLPEVTFHVDGRERRVSLQDMGRLILSEGGRYGCHVNLAKELQLDRPGRYVVTAGLNIARAKAPGDWTGDVRSAPITIDILAVTPENRTLVENLPMQALPLAPSFGAEADPRQTPGIRVAVEGPTFETGQRWDTARFLGNTGEILHHHRVHGAATGAILRSIDQSTEGSVLSTDGAVLASPVGGFRGPRNIERWYGVALADVKTGRSLKTIELKEGAGCVAFPASGPLIMLDWNNKFFLIDPQTARLTNLGHGADSRDIAVSPDGKQYAKYHIVFPEDGRGGKADPASVRFFVTIHDLETGKEIVRLPETKGSVESWGLTWTPEGDHIIAVGRERHMNVFHIPSRKLLGTHIGRWIPAFQRQMIGGRFLLLIDNNSRSAFLDLQTQGIVRTAGPDGTAIQILAISPDGKVAVVNAVRPGPGGSQAITVSLAHLQLLQPVAAALDISATPAKPSPAATQPATRPAETYAYGTPWFNALVGRLRLAMPGGWELDVPAEAGLAPKHQPPGRGVLIRMYPRNLRRPSGLTAGEVVVWIMSAAYDGPAAALIPTSSDGELPGELEPWHGHRIFVWGPKAAAWATCERDIKAALQATATAPEASAAAELAEVARRLRDEAGGTWEVCAAGVQQVRDVSGAKHIGYFHVLPAGLDEAGRAQLTGYQWLLHGAPLTILGANGRYTVLADPAADPGLAARVSKALNLSASGVTMAQLLRGEKPAAPVTQPEAVRELARGAVAMTAETVGFRGGQQDTGLDLAAILKLTGQDKDVAAFAKDHRFFRQDISAMLKARKGWALCGLLNHENGDAKVYAARALAELADPDTAPVLLAAAKRNNYRVAGSESATIHWLYRTALHAGLLRITRVAPPGVATPGPVEGEPLDQFFRDVPEKVDLPAMEGWIRERFLQPSATAPASRPGGVRDVARLMAALKEGDADGRAQAAFELGRRRERGAVEPLMAALKDADYVVRCRAGVALGTIGDTRAIPAMLEAMKTGGTGGDYRLDPVQGLVVMGKAAVDPLLAVAVDTRQEVRYRSNAIWIVGRLGDRRAVKPLIACLQEADPLVRAAAAVALGFLGEPLAADPLAAARQKAQQAAEGGKTDAIAKLTEQAAAKNAAQALDRIAAGGVAGFDSSDPAQVRRAAGQFIEALRRDDLHLGAHLGKGILAAEPSLAAEALAKVLDARDLGVRRGSVIDMLWLARIRQAVPKLIELLGDATPHIPATAATALGILGDRSAVGPLQRLLAAGPDQRTADVTRRALGQLGQPYLQYFVRGLADPEHEKRYWAMAALGEIRDVRAVPALYALLSMPRYWDGHFAATALERITGVPVLGVSKEGYQIQRPMEEIRGDLLGWMGAHAAELSRPIEACPDRWPFSPLAPLYVDVLPLLREGMTRQQVKAIVGHEGGVMKEAGVESLPADVSGRWPTVIFSHENGVATLKKWWLEPSSWAARAAEAAGAPRALWFFRVRWNERFTGTVQVHQLLMDTTGGLPMMNGLYHRLTAEQAAAVELALATEGFPSPGEAKDQWPWPETKDYPGGVWVLRAGKQERIIGPSLQALRLLHRLRAAMPAAAQKSLDILSTDIAAELGVPPYAPPAASHPATQPSPSTTRPAGWRPAPTASAAKVTATEAAARVERFRANHDKFWVHISCSPGKNEPPFSLLLAVPRQAPRMGPLEWLVQIDARQADRIIDWLAESGIAAEARNAAGRKFPPLPPPSCTLYAAGPPDLALYANLGWGLPMLERLDGLQKALDGDAGKAVAAFLGRLDGQRRQWQNQGDAAPRPAARAGGDWPMFGGDAGHSGIAAGPGVGANNRVRWTFRCEGAVRSSPVAAEGVVYIADYGPGAKGGRLHAVHAESGRELWAFQLEKAAYSATPAVAGGVVYFAGGSRNVYALEAGSGRELWRFDTGNWVESNPLVLNGKVYFAGRDGNCYAVDARTGRKAWGFNAATGGECYITSPVGAGDTVYFGACRSRVGSAIHALDAATGKQRWTYPVATGDGANQFSPLAIHDGVLYFGDGDHNGGVHGLGAGSGRLVWSFNAGARVTGTPLIHDGVAYLGLDNAHFTAVRMKDNEVLWAFGTREKHDRGIASPVLVAGRLYFTAADGRLYCLRASDGVKEWETATDRERMTSVAPAGDRIYVGAREGLCAIEQAGADPAPAAAVAPAPEYADAKALVAAYRKAGRTEQVRLRSRLMNRAAEVLPVAEANLASEPFAQPKRSGWVGEAEPPDQSTGEMLRMLARIEEHAPAVKALAVRLTTSANANQRAWAHFVLRVFPLPAQEAATLPGLLAKETDDSVRLTIMERLFYVYYTPSGGLLTALRRAEPGWGWDDRLAAALRTCAQSNDPNVLSKMGECLRHIPTAAATEAGVHAIVTHPEAIERFAGFLDHTTSRGDAWSLTPAQTETIVGLLLKTDWNRMPGHSDPLLRLLARMRDRRVLPALFAILEKHPDNRSLQEQASRCLWQMFQFDLRRFIPPDNAGGQFGPDPLKAGRLWRDWYKANAHAIAWDEKEGAYRRVREAPRPVTLEQMAARMKADLGGDWAAVREGEGTKAIRCVRGVVEVEKNSLGLSRMIWFIVPIADADSLAALRPDVKTRSWCNEHWCITGPGENVLQLPPVSERTYKIIDVLETLIPAASPAPATQPAPSATQAAGGAQTRPGEIGGVYRAIVVLKVGRPGELVADVFKAREEAIAALKSDGLLGQVTVEMGESRVCKEYFPAGADPVKTLREAIDTSVPPANDQISVSMEGAGPEQVTWLVHTVAQAACGWDKRVTIDPQTSTPYLMWTPRPSAPPARPPVREWDKPEEDGGSSLRDSLAKQRIAMVAAGEAAAPAKVTLGYSGAIHVVQDFRLPEVFYGPETAGQIVPVAYSYSYLRGPSRPFVPGERVIWIVTEDTGCMRVAAAIPDTPANRQAMKALAANIPPGAFQAILDDRAREAMVRRVSKAQPAGWAGVSQRLGGDVSPMDWGAGKGVEITCQRQGYRSEDRKRGLGGEVRLWIMDPGYAGHLPAVATRPDAEPSGQPNELAPWRGRRVFLQGGAVEWPTLRRDILAALAATATDPPATQPAANAGGAFEEALGRRVPFNVYEDVDRNGGGYGKWLYDAPDLARRSLLVAREAVEGQLLKRTPTAWHVEVPEKGGIPLEISDGPSRGWLPAAKARTVREVFDELARNRDRSDVRVELTCPKKTVVSGEEVQAVLTFTNTSGGVRTVTRSDTLLRNAVTAVPLFRPEPGIRNLGWSAVVQDLPPHGTVTMSLALKPTLSATDAPGSYRLYALYHVRPGRRDDPVPVPTGAEMVSGILDLTVVAAPGPAPAPEDAAFRKTTTARYWDSLTLLRSGAPRGPLAARLRSIKDFSDAPYYQEPARELAGLLEQMDKEDAAFKEPADPQALKGKERIDYLIFKLRDVTAQETSVPGRCNIFDGFSLVHVGDKVNAAWALAQIGEPAVPALLALLEDRRPVRAASGPMNGSHVVRYADVALQAIEQIAGQKFDKQNMRGRYLTNADEPTRAAIIQAVNAWWQKHNKDSGATPAPSTPATTQPAGSILEHFGIGQLEAVTVTHAPAGDFKAADRVTVTSRDAKALAEVAAVLRLFPARGSVSKKWPAGMERWHIELQAGSARHTLMVCGVRLECPNGAFSRDPATPALEKRLLEAVRAIAAEPTVKERRAMLEKNVARFDMQIEFQGDRDTKCRSLRLHVLEMEDKRPPNWPSVQISEEQARKIIAHLAAEGFLGRARPNRPKTLRKGPGEYWLTVSCPGLELHDCVGLDEGVYRRLGGLRPVLEGRAGTEMDALLKVLEGMRATLEKQEQWRQLEADATALAALLTDEKMPFDEWAAHAAKQPFKVRRQMINVFGDWKGDEAIKRRVFLHFLRTDGEENLRVACASSLSPADKESTDALLAALKDKSPGMRLFACQSLGTHPMGAGVDREAVCRAVLGMVDDPEASVAHTAVRGLGFLKYAPGVERIIRHFRQRGNQANEAWACAEALAALGERQVVLEAAHVALGSENWNTRNSAIRALKQVDSPAVVTLLIEQLGGQVPPAAANFKEHHIDPEVLLETVRLLHARTGRRFGLQVNRWADWLESHPAGFPRPAGRVRRLDEAAQKQLDAMLESRWKRVWGPGWDYKAKALLQRKGTYVIEDFELVKNTALSADQAAEEVPPSEMPRFAQCVGILLDLLEHKDQWQFGSDVRTGLPPGDVLERGLRRVQGCRDILPEPAAPATQPAVGDGQGPVNAWTEGLFVGRKATFEGTIPGDLPPATMAGGPEPVRVVIAADETLSVAGRTLSDDELRPLLQAAAKADPRRAVFIQSDRKVKWKRTVDVFNLAVKAGFTEVGLVPTRAADTQPATREGTGRFVGTVSATLPNSGGRLEKRPADPVWVAVEPDETVTLYGLAVSDEALSDILTAVAKSVDGRGVVIRPRQKASWGRTLQVFDLAKKTGVKSVNLAPTHGATPPPAQGLWGLEVPLAADAMCRKVRSREGWFTLRLIEYCATEGGESSARELLHLDTREGMFHRENVEGVGISWEQAEKVAEYLGQVSLMERSFEEGNRRYDPGTILLRGPRSVVLKPPDVARLDEFLRGLFKDDRRAETYEEQARGLRKLAAVSSRRPMTTGFVPIRFEDGCWRLYGGGYRTGRQDKEFLAALRAAAGHAPAEIRILDPQKLPVAAATDILKLLVPAGFRIAPPPQPATREGVAGQGVGP